MTPAQLHTLAQCLYDTIPPELRTWQPTTSDPATRDALADDLLMACEDAGVSGAVTGEAETSIQAVIIAETLAGFLTGSGCRYGNLDDDVERAQATLIQAMGGTVLGSELGHYALPDGLPLTVEAIETMLSGLLMVDRPEA
jgi:hypothetical protein